MILIDILQFLVRENDASVECLSHEQVFAERAAALTQDLIRKHGDDGRECEDEAVDVFHVEEVGGNSVRDGVLSQSLRGIFGQPDHLLHLHLNRVVVQLSLGHGLESSRPLRQKSIPIDPMVAVKMRDVTAEILATLLRHSHLRCKLQEVEFHPAFNVRIIEFISVVGRDNVGVVSLDETAEPKQQILLCELVVNSYVACVLRFWLVIELLYSLPAVGKIHDQKRFSLVHQTDHHDFILLRIRELQRILRRLNIIRKDLEFRHSALSRCWLNIQYNFILQLHLKPFSRPQTSINTNSRVERYVELSNAGDEIRHVLEVFRLDAAVERVIIIVLPFSSLVNEAFQWSLSVGEILDGAEVDLKVLFFPAGKMILLLEVYLLLNFNRFYLLKFGLKIGLNLLLHSFLKSDVKVRSIGQHALDQFSILALEEAKHCHSFLVIMQLILVGPGLEVGEKSEDASRSIVEGNPHFFLELLAFILRSIPHYAPIISVYMQREPKIINNPHQTDHITVLGNLQGVFFSQGLAVRLKEKYRIAAKMIGLREVMQDCRTRVKIRLSLQSLPFISIDGHKELCEQEGIVLKIGSKEVENRLEELSKEKHARIFMHLIKEFYLIDGHKFGCTFLAYDADPETYHAKHLIFIDEESLNHMSRLSGIAKKIGLIATLNQENEVRLLQVERLNSRRE